MSIGAKVNFSNAIAESMSAILTVKQAEALREAIMKTMETYDVETVRTSEAMPSSMDALNAFLQAKRTEGCSAKTIAHYRYVISRFMKHMGVQESAVTVHHLRAYLASEEERGVSDKTRQNVRNVMCSYFGWLTDEELIRKNPTVNLHAIKAQKKVRTPFSATEIERILECCTSRRDTALVEFLLATGCRISEVVALNRDQIDLRSREVVVHGKGNKDRTVYMDDVTCMHMARYLADRTDDNDAAFISMRRERLTDDGARVILNRIADESGVEHVHPHRFRRTLATSLINRGMPIQEVATILGHANINITMTYVYMDDVKTKTSYMRHTA